MKEQWSISKERLASLEEGQTQAGEFTFARPSDNGVCYQLIQAVKLILYLQLILFVGWGCYTILQPYRVQSIEVKVTDMTSKSQSPLDQETMHETTTAASTEPNDYQRFLTRIDELLAKSILTQQMEDVGDTFGKEEVDNVINAVQTIDSEIDAIRIPLLNANSDNEFILQSTESPSVVTADFRDDIEATVEETAETDESTEKEDIMVWTFPFQWSIHGLENRENSDVDESKDKEISETPAITEKCIECDDMHNDMLEKFLQNYDSSPVYDSFSSNEKLEQEKSDLDEDLDYEEDGRFMPIGYNSEYSRFRGPRLSERVYRLTERQMAKSKLLNQ